MQLAPPPVRKALVGGVANEGVAEAQLAVRLLVEILGQPPPDAGIRRFLERGDDEVLPEAGPDDGCAAQDAPVGGRKAVDLSQHERLHRLRKLSKLPCARGSQKLGEEEWVAAG